MVYEWLRDHGDGRPLVEVPIARKLWGTVDSYAMYYSTFHWLPLVNGHSSYLPEISKLLRGYADQLPAPEPLAVLRACIDLRWVVAHKSARSEHFPWRRSPGLAPLLIDRDPVGLAPELVLYGVLPAEGADCPPNFFVEAEPIANPEALRGTVAVRGLDAPMRPKGRYPIEIEVVNLDERTFPGPRFPTEARVEVGFEWTHRSTGRRWLHPFASIPLPRDVEPGQSLRWRGWLRTPMRGTYELRVILAPTTVEKGDAVGIETTYEVDIRR